MYTGTHPGVSFSPNEPFTPYHFSFQTSKTSLPDSHSLKWPCFPFHWEIEESENFPLLPSQVPNYLSHRSVLWFSPLVVNELQRLTIPSACQRDPFPFPTILIQHLSHLTPAICSTLEDLSNQQPNILSLLTLKTIVFKLLLIPHTPPASISFLFIVEFFESVTRDFGHDGGVGKCCVCPLSWHQNYNHHWKNHLESRWTEVL